MASRRALILNSSCFFCRERALSWLSNSASFVTSAVALASRLTEPLSALEILQILLGDIQLVFDGSELPLDEFQGFTGLLGFKGDVALLVHLGQGVDHVPGLFRVGALVGKADDAGFGTYLHSHDAALEAVGGVCQRIRGQGYAPLLIHRPQALDHFFSHAAGLDDLYLGIDRILCVAGELRQQVTLAALGSLNLQGGKRFIDRFDAEGIECRPQKNRKKYQQEHPPAEHDDAQILAEVDFGRLLQLGRRRGHRYPFSNNGKRLRRGTPAALTTSNSNPTDTL